MGSLSHPLWYWRAVAAVQCSHRSDHSLLIFSEAGHPKPVSRTACSRVGAVGILHSWQTSLFDRSVPLPGLRFRHRILLRESMWSGRHGLRIPGGNLIPICDIFRAATRARPGCWRPRLPKTMEPYGSSLSSPGLEITANKTNYHRSNSGAAVQD